jgi:hypothetical protein
MVSGLVPLGAPSGAAVLRRLEQRRRLHKSRTASCSSSDASDEDSESRYRTVLCPKSRRRLEQRRRLHKSRTASCTSSDASDEDSESRYRAMS